MNSIFAPKPVTSVASPKVGDLLCGSFGYEACIHQVFKVVGVTGSSVKIQELVLDRKYTGGGGMNWTSTVTNEARGPVSLKRVISSHDGYSVKVHSSLRVYGPWTPCELEGYNHH